MNLELDRKRLAEELALLERVTPRRAAIPVLTFAHVVADAAARTLTMTATDGRVGMRTVLRDVDVSASGTTLLPVAKASDLVGSLDDPTVHLTATEDTLTLSAGGYKSKLQTMAASDYPALPEPTADNPSCVFPDARVLGALVDRTAYAVNDHEEARAGGTATMGALLTVADGEAWMVGTNGHRLAASQYAMPDQPEATWLLSRRLLTACTGILDAEVEATVSRGVMHAFVRAGDRMVFGPMVEGEFPGWRRMIQTHPVCVRVPRVPLVNALKRARMLSIDSRAIFRFASNALSVSAVEVGIGSGDETLTVEYPHDEIAFALNAGYLLDFLSAVDNESHVLFSIRDSPMAAVYVRATEGAVQSTYVIMPMRL